MFSSIGRNEYSVQKFLLHEYAISKSYNKETSLKTTPFQLHLLDSGPREIVSLNRNEALDLYHKMKSVRQLELEAADLYYKRLVKGFLHLYTGQEACCVGMKASMRPRDSVITGYRCHGWAYVMGIPIRKILAELLGRKTGCCCGRGGSMHMCGPNFYGGRVGGQVPVGAGIAFAYKYSGKMAVCIDCYGDGAANSGQVFETYQISKLFKLPIIFVCENNQYGMGTSISRASAKPSFYNRCGYIPGVWVDGMDVLAVREAARFGIEWCVSGKGPLILELCTHRFCGHSITDPCTSYRTWTEVQEVRKCRDPIELLKMRILADELATEEEIKEINWKIKKSVKESAKEASADPFPSTRDLTKDVSHMPVNKFVQRVESSRS